MFKFFCSSRATAEYQYDAEGRVVGGLSSPLHAARGPSSRHSSLATSNSVRGSDEDEWSGGDLPAMGDGGEGDSSFGGSLPPLGASSGVGAVGVLHPEPSQASALFKVMYCNWPPVSSDCFQ